MNTDSQGMYSSLCNRSSLNLVIDDYDTGMDEKQ